MTLPRPPPPPSARCGRCSPASSATSTPSSSAPASSATAASRSTTRWMPAGRGGVRSVARGPAARHLRPRPCPARALEARGRSLENRALNLARRTRRSARSRSSTTAQHRARREARACGTSWCTSGGIAARADSRRAPAARALEAPRPASIAEEWDERAVDARTASAPRPRPLLRGRAPLPRRRWPSAPPPRRDDRPRVPPATYHEIPTARGGRGAARADPPEVAGYWHDVGHAEVQHRLGLVDRWRVVRRSPATASSAPHLHDVDGLRDHRAPGTRRRRLRLARRARPTVGRAHLRDRPARAGRGCGAGCGGGATGPLELERSRARSRTDGGWLQCPGSPREEEDR